MTNGLGVGLGLFGLTVTVPWFLLSRWPVPTVLVALLTRFDWGCDLLWWYADRVNHVQDPLSVLVAVTGVALCIGLQGGANALVGRLPPTR